MPFAGADKLLLTLKFKRYDWKPIEQNYAEQVSLPHFTGHYRQRGSDFGTMAAVIDRAAIPFARRVSLTAAKKGQITFDDCSARTDRFEKLLIDS